MFLDVLVGMDAALKGHARDPCKKDVEDLTSENDDLAGVDVAGWNRKAQQLVISWIGIKCLQVLVTLWDLHVFHNNFWLRPFKGYM